MDFHNYRDARGLYLFLNHGAYLRRRRCQECGGSLPIFLSGSRPWLHGCAFLSRNLHGKGCPQEAQRTTRTKPCPLGCRGPAILPVQSASASRLRLDGRPAAGFASALLMATSQIVPCSGASARASGLRFYLL